MAATNWRIAGDYFETCNCDYLCPCIYTNMLAQPTHDDCIAAITMRVNDGNFGDTDLAGVAFIIAIRVVGPMANGNWTVGLIIDEKASDAQVGAVAQICSGDFGGPMETGAADPNQPIYIDNTAHPANKRLALATGSESHMHVFGIDWDDAEGGHNGHFAPFDWSPA
ncbi:MAG: DUF1326 domain-containing protein [Alphaproteobacteria bacterium]|jgi:hypothetical protein|nr:DUF1326 domain-containing protein [Alphaproteobacteria bacterium]MDP6818521.1 DUF1326 domain-containing protein [Alphaproteobacteria bacterium]